MDSADGDLVNKHDEDLEYADEDLEKSALPKTGEHHARGARWAVLTEHMKEN